MNAELATLDERDQVAALRSLQVAAIQLSADDALDMMQRAKLAREWIKIHKASATIAQEARRLEFLSLRRVGQLDPARAGNLSDTAAWLAGLDESAFEEWVESGRTTTPLGAYRMARREKYERYDRMWGERTSRDEIDGVNPQREAADDANGIEWRRHYRSAARELLQELCEVGEPFEVRDAAARLCERLDIASDNPINQEATEELIRYALRHEARNGEYIHSDYESRPYIGMPEFVTWMSLSRGWVRVPLEASSLSQLRWMLDYRRSQIREMEAKADRLASFVEMMEKAAERKPEKANCGELLNYLDHLSPTKSWIAPYVAPKKSAAA